MLVLVSTRQMYSQYASLPSTRYPQGEPRVQILKQACERLETLPGVQSVGAVLSLPLSGDTFNVGRSYIREGRPATPEESSNAAYLPATPNYFRALQIPVVAGGTLRTRIPRKHRRWS